MNSAAIIIVIQAVHLHPRYDMVRKPPIGDIRIELIDVEKKGLANYGAYYWPNKGSSSENYYGHTSIDGVENVVEGAADDCQRC
jgi:hypothetical protein